MSQTTNAVIAELMDRRLLNDVDDDLHQEIADAVIKAARLSRPDTAEARLREALAWCISEIELGFARSRTAFPPDSKKEKQFAKAKALLSPPSGGDEGKESAPDFKAAQNNAESDPSVTPDCSGADTAPPADRREIVARLLTTAKLLLENAIGCATNHYGHDCELNGLPGWLTDCERDIKAAATALDSLSARVNEADEACQRLCGAHGFATGHGDSVADMIDEISTQIGTLEERALRAEQQRDEAYERAAKICDAEFDRIISKQTPTDDPLSMADTVNTNIRMMACILPEVAAAIRRLASGPEGGSVKMEEN